MTDLGQEGVANGEVYTIAKEGYDILVTSDRHFRRPTPFPATESLGIIYVRVTPGDIQSTRFALKSFLEEHDLSEAVGRKAILRRDDSEFLV